MVLDKFGAPKVINYGATIVQAIDLSDAMENAEASLI